MKSFLYLCFTLLSLFGAAQTFTSASGGSIPDNNTEVCFPVMVNVIGTINGTYGLSRVCMDISHTAVGNLDISLKAPDGTVVPLSIRNGNFGNNYTGTCFTATATNSIANGFPPFTGTFKPQGYLGSVNNNQAASGLWYLCIKDASAPDSGRLLSFSLTFSNTPAPPPPPPPVNDEPCSALNLPVTTSCTYTTFSNDGATATNGVAAPGCATYTGGDVWFTATVPSNGILQIDTKEGVMLDGGMALYTGRTCNALSLLKCDDNTSNNGFMPLITQTGLTPGSIVYIRVWEKGNDNNGTFGICVTTPPPIPACSGNPAAGNTCFQATQICNSEGFCGNTSSSYTVDVWPELTSAFNCGSIQNNSFLKFTAAATTASFNVWVTTSLRNGGIQLLIYSGGCGSGAVTRHICVQRVPPSNGVPTLVTATGLTPGNTYFIMVDGYSADVCDYVIAPNTGTSVLNVGPTTAPSTEICQGKSVQLTAVGGNNVYAWSPAAGLNTTTGSTVIASPDTTTTYTITSSAPTGCTGTLTKSLTVTVNPTPLLGADTSLSICQGSAVDLTTIRNPPGASMQWILKGVSISNPAAATDSGKYQAISINSFGCSDTAIVSVALINKLKLGRDTVIRICPGNATNVAAAYNTNVSGWTSTWSFNNGPIPAPVSVSAPGNYQVIVTDGSSCPDTAIASLAIAPSIPGTPEIVRVCPNQLPYNWNGWNYTTAGTYKDTIVSSAGCDSIATLQLIVKSVTSSTTTVSVCPSQLPYLWNGNSYTASGTYSDTLVNAAGCDSIAILQFTVKTNTINANTVNICPSDLPYLWNGVQYDSAGTYTIIRQNTQGCDSTVILNLIVNPVPPAPFASSNSPACTGTELKLSVVIPSGGTCRWNGPKGFTSTQSSPVISDVTSANSGNYSVFVTLNGCQSPTSITPVSVLPAPTINAGPNRTAYEGDTISFVPQYTGVIAAYKWTPDEFLITGDSVRNPVAIAVTDVTYTVQATGANTCESKPASFSIRVLPRIKPFNIPNTFSPNGDGINDTWIIRDLAAFTKARVQVFTRYGNQVFSSEGFAKGWDGNSAGKPLPAGIYYYVIQPKEDSKALSGWVMIVR